MGMETGNSSLDVELEGRRMAVGDDLSGRLARMQGGVMKTCKREEVRKSLGGMRYLLRRVLS